MSEAYERERQNNSSLTALSAKITQLRSVTVDIYDQARDQHVIDHNLETFSNFGGSLSSSARRLTTMARQGDRTAILKIAGWVVGAGLLLWVVLKILGRVVFGAGK